jgi:hypothetical protein
MVDLAVQSITGVKSTKSSTSGKLSASGNEVAIGEASAQGLAPNSGQFRDASGRLRNSDGTFAYAGGPNKPVTSGSHGNIAGDQKATLYELYDKDGNFLKHGISQDPSKRYTQKELDGGYLIETQVGPRKEILKLERDLVETNPGPRNKEPWAGKRSTKQ